ncbi:MAG: NYN domain-containing protein [Candidatus Theseobacter exili]|nr:NYN domain-containing protein [Candidatus Theseobacter exili]
MPSFIVDGYNLIYKIPELRKILDVNLENARNSLLQYVSGYSQGKNLSVAVVFDGSQDESIVYPHRIQGVRAIYSPPGKKADDVIVSMAKRASKPGEIIVVTADFHTIIIRLRGMGVKFQSPQEFWRLIRRKTVSSNYKNEKPVTIEEKDMQRWLKIFSEENSE